MNLEFQQPMYVGLSNERRPGEQQRGKLAELACLLAPLGVRLIDAASSSESRSRRDRDELRRERADQGAARRGRDRAAGNR